MVGSAYPDEGWEVYRGPIPEPSFGPPQGTADEWANGTLYSVYKAGGYGAMGSCINLRTATECKATAFGVEGYPSWVPGRQESKATVYNGNQTPINITPAVQSKATHNHSPLPAYGALLDGRSTHEDIILPPGLAESQGLTTNDNGE